MLAWGDARPLFLLCLLWGGSSTSHQTGHTPALENRCQATMNMGRFGRKGLDQEHENQPALILAIALLAAPRPHRFGRPPFGRGVRLAFVQALPLRAGRLSRD